MMVRSLLPLLPGVLLLAVGAAVAAQESAITSDTGWSELPQIPDPLGVAGPFVGVSNGVLIVAGGANFADGIRPWKGGVKTWRDAVYLLDDPDGPWRTCPSPLPRPIGYGVSVTTPEGVWCIGGSDHGRHYADVVLMRYDNGAVTFIPQPDLPIPLANSCGALVGTAIVVAGGTESPSSTSASKHVFMLDTADSPAARQWKQLPACPGDARMLATAGASGNDFYLFGGVVLKAGRDGAPERIKPFLNEVWRLRLGADGGTWTRLADLPAPRAAGPSPAPLVAGNRLLVISGDDGSLDAAQEDRHTGFASTTLAYDVDDDRWTSLTPVLRWNGSSPASKPEECVWPPVTTGIAIWQGMLVIPSGEIRPGVRTRRVLTAGDDLFE